MYYPVAILGWKIWGTAPRQADAPSHGLRPKGPSEAQRAESGGGIPGKEAASPISTS